MTDEEAPSRLSGIQGRVRSCRKYFFRVPNKLKKVTLLWLRARRMRQMDEQRSGVEQGEECGDCLIGAAGIFSTACGMELQKATIFSENMIRHRKAKLRWGLVTWVFTGLNIIALVNDAMSCHASPNAYFLVALILRAIFLPVSVLMNAVVPFGFYCKEGKVRWVMRLGPILAIASIIAAIVVGAAVSRPLSRWQVTELATPSAEWSAAAEFQMPFEICDAAFGASDLRLIDLAGLALGPYQRGRDSVAEAQMQHFFGPGWKSEFEIEPVDVTLNRLSAFGRENAHPSTFPFDIITHVTSGRKVVAFRGFGSSAEFAFQLELIAAKFLMPAVSNVLPLFDLVGENMLGDFARHAHLFGYFFFSPTGFSDAFIEPVRAALETKNITDALYVGFNTGGVIAKLLGATSANPAVGLWGLPLLLPHLQHRWGFDAADGQFTTTVSNQGGLWATPEEGAGGLNFVIPWVSLSALEHDTVLQSLCTLAEMCGQHPRLGEFCTSALGEEELSKVRAELGETLIPQLLVPARE
jgi:hypothetical protein